MPTRIAPSGVPRLASFSRICATASGETAIVRFETPVSIFSTCSKPGPLGCRSVLLMVVIVIEACPLVGARRSERLLGLERLFGRLLGAEIGDRALDRVLGEDGAVDLHRRQVKLLGDHA